MMERHEILFEVRSTVTTGWLAWSVRWLSKGVDWVAPNPCLRAVVVVTGRDKGMPVYFVGPIL
jgi:hypothetical protein